MASSLPKHIQSIVTALATTILVLVTTSARSNQAAAVDDILKMSLESLLSMDVTSVAKKKQQLSDAAAAVFVITQDDIRRSGVTSIPEALRLAPGVEVGRIDANKWAITTRGFNSQFANKLLVLIDGRSVYTPSFSGVYWDAQDTLLEDIHRIEVIRGPGATLWGANAVNGIINIITRDSVDTRGGFVELGAGTEEKAFTGLRYGTDINDDTTARVYAKFFKRDDTILASTDSDAGDAWDSMRGGFRIDGRSKTLDNWTLQGDHYRSNISQVSQTVAIDPDVFYATTMPTSPPYPTGVPIPATEPGITDHIVSTGWNLLGKFDKVLSESSSYSFQFYYDHSERAETFLTQIHDILDIEFQHNVVYADKHDINWGFGIRHIEDEYINSFTVSVNPTSETRELINFFVQDEIELLDDRLYLTLGSKFEHNPYTKYEIQPNVRALWKIDDASRLWASVSRAVRTPSRFDQNGAIIPFTAVILTGSPAPAPAYIPITMTINGNSDGESEDVLAYEIGYRLTWSKNLSFDIAGFVNEYDDLHTAEAVDPLDPYNYDTFTGNKMYGESTGVELAIDWRPALWWRLQGSISSIRIETQLDADSTDSGDKKTIAEGSSPDNHISLLSSMDLSEQVEFNLWLNYVDNVPVSSSAAIANAIQIDTYTSINARIGWYPSETLEVSVAGMNLQNSNHTEFVGVFSNGESRIEPSLHASLKWRF